MENNTEEKKKENQPAIEKKRKKEQYVVTEMIALYCRKNHKNVDKQNALCPECEELATHAAARSEHCPRMEEKTFCVNCKIHCYKPEMRERIRVVMRFSGPRMLLYHPILAIWHLITTIKEKRGTK